MTINVPDHSSVIQVHFQFIPGHSGTFHSHAIPTDRPTPFKEKATENWFTVSLSHHFCSQGRSRVYPFDEERTLL